MTSRTARRTYDARPSLPVLEGGSISVREEVWDELVRYAEARGATTIVIDAYPGVELADVRAQLAAHMPAWSVVDVEQRAALSRERREALIARNLTDDRVFGMMSHFELEEFYDSAALADIASELARNDHRVVLLGWGAALVPADNAVLVVADMARWEIQRRQRDGAPNWHAGNDTDDALRKFKRGYFVEWRTADRHKLRLLDRTDFVLDTNRGATDAALITGASFRAALEAATRRPFRVVPFFDPGVWGGQWMKDKLGLDPTAANYAWCFDCVPEENSLLLEDDGRLFELPAIDLVLTKPRELLGERTFARFGAEFPIRFDFLDTMGGGNLSLQVHPLTEYIRDRFGMSYTQDESYYLLDCDEDAVVYLGLKTGIDRDSMIDDLRRAATGESTFNATDYVNAFPAKKHDHFSIPAGTVHCSGANSMVLEISATPYIFTFKLWDWGRVGLDGIPRPIHVDHGAANIQWNRDTEWVQRELLDQVEVVSDVNGVVEERTGLHALEFIETRRHWFSERVEHDTRGTVNVLNLVEGDEVEVVSPSGAFDPFTVHYAETFIVPAAVGPYIIQRTSASQSERFGTITASVRGTATSSD